jgi:hypothetical protein
MSKRAGSGLGLGYVSRALHIKNKRSRSSMDKPWTAMND